MLQEAPLFYNAPWDNNIEPNSGNVRHWLDNLYSKFQPLEQSRADAPY